MPTHSHPHAHATGHAHDRGHDPARRHLLQTASRPKPTRSVLAWPAWLRVAAVLPIVLLLWLAVLWANEGTGLW